MLRLICLPPRQPVTTGESEKVSKEGGEEKNARRGERGRAHVRTHERERAHAHNGGRAHAREKEETTRSERLGLCVGGRGRVGEVGDDVAVFADTAYIYIY